MRILIVCSGNARGFDFRKHQAFVYDQVEALKQLNTELEFDYFFVKGKGVKGYLSCLQALRRQVDRGRYHCLHAHVAMSGLLANLQRRVPVITTFHGFDINVPLLRLVALAVEWLSRRTIYISPALRGKALIRPSAKQAIIPCGVDFERFRPRDPAESRRRLGLSPDKRYILFSSAFTNPVKNYPLARAAVDLLQDERVELLELSGFTRDEVALLFSAVDVALMTSFSEGSPQFIKEALACNCPVVSTDVGDVRTVTAGIANCHLTSYDPADVAACLRRALEQGRSPQAREHIQHLDNRLVARQVLTLYNQL